ERDIADQCAFTLDIDACRGRAAERGTAGVTEFAVFEVITSSAGEAQPLAAIVAAREMREPASRDAPRIADDLRAILAVVVAVDIFDSFAAEIADQHHACRRHLPAQVSEFATHV